MSKPLQAFVFLSFGCIGTASAADAQSAAMRDAQSAVPPIARPEGASCAVSLFKDEAFGQVGDPKAMTAKPLEFGYQPPKECGTAWSKVVLEVDFSVPAGRQYDRTAAVWLGGTNLYFGTTQEPDARIGAQWHVERDVTDYAPLFRTAQIGQGILNNWLSDKYTSVIHGSARLVFYPAAKGAAPAAGADAVFALSDDPRGSQAALQNGTERLHKQLTLPRNAERIYMDVIAQSQGNDEPWYTCIDDAYVAKTQAFALESPYDGAPLQECGGGTLRQVLVTVDNQPAGLAPVYPRTYTGGVDPHLWRPMPDLQTLNFIPYRLDLTPFAALLDDGHPHDVSVQVLGANRFFNAAASLLVYEDHASRTLTGELVQNTLQSASDLGKPQVQSTLHTTSGDRIEGTVNTARQDRYQIAGVLKTSHGEVRTEVSQHSRFKNDQTFTRPDGVLYHQVIDQATDVEDVVTTKIDGGAAVERHRTVAYPLRLDVTKRIAPDGSFQGGIDMSQGLKIAEQNRRGSEILFSSSLDQSIQSHDDADFGALGSPITHPHNEHAVQRYLFKDSLGSCSAMTLESSGENVATPSAGAGCPKGANHISWHSRADGQPAS